MHCFSNLCLLTPLLTWIQSLPAGEQSVRKKTAQDQQHKSRRHGDTIDKQHSAVKTQVDSTGGTQHVPVSSLREKNGSICLMECSCVYWTSRRNTKTFDNRLISNVVWCAVWHKAWTSDSPHNRPVLFDSPAFGVSFENSFGWVFYPA